MVYPSGTIEELQKSEEQYRRIFEDAPFGICVAGLDGSILRVNAALCRMVGYSEEEMLATVWGELDHPDDLGPSLERLKQLLQDLGGWVDAEKRYIHRDGSVVWGRMRASLARDDDGTPLYFVIHTEDITGRKRAEDVLHESEERFRIMADGCPTVMWVTNAEGGNQFINRAYREFFGTTYEEAEGGKWQLLVHPDDLAEYSERFQRATHAHTAFEIEARVRRADGEWRWIATSAEPRFSSSGEFLGHVGLSPDITGRKHAEQVLQFQNSLLRAINEGAPDGILVVNKAGIVVSHNKRYLDIWQISPPGNPEDRSVISMDNPFHEFFSACLNRVKDPAPFLQRVRELYDDPSAEDHCEIALKDGRTLERDSNGLRSESGQYLGRIWFFRDITAHKQAEQALRKSEAKFRQFAENIHEVIWMVPVTADEKPYVSPAYEQIWGRTRESLYRDPTSWLEVIHPDDLEPARKRFAAQLAGEATEAQYRIRTPDGQEKWIRDRTFPVFDPAGQLIRIVGIAEEITGRKRAEQVLQFQHSLLRAIHEGSPDGILVVNDQGLVLSHNKRLLDIMQISQPDILDAPPDNAVGISDQPLLSAVADLVKDPEPFLKRVQELYDDPDAKDDCELTLKDGRTLERYSTGLRSESGKYLGRVWFFRDITPRKQAEQARMSSEKAALEWKKRLELAEKATLPIGLWERDLSAGTFVCSEEVYRQIGYTPDSFPGGDTLTDRIHPEDRSRVEAAIQSVVSGLSPSYDVQFRVIKRDGTTCWIDSRGTMASEGSSRMIGIAIDITKLHRAEADYRSMVETAPYGIFRSTADGRCLAANPALTNMLGYDCESELLSLDIERDLYCDPEERARLAAGFFETGSLKDLEVDWKRKDGRTITVRISAVQVRGGNGKIEAIGFIQDVTERKSLARQFWQAQKMEAIGRLAGGVAHDFNNVLMIVSSYADLILQSQDTDEKVSRYAKQIFQSATKAVSVTRQLLAFSRQQLLEPEILDLNTIVDELGKILPKLLGEDIAVVTALEPELHPVRVDHGQMEQIVMNLAVNARDAMPKGGHFGIKTQNVELDATYAAEHPPMNPGLYVKLSVTDSGIGMDPETQLHIFEPFFTTKERGKGTGLGLATVYGIVKQSGGFIWVSSEVGRGTTFDVYLPQHSDPVTRAPKLQLTNATSGGSETILLVEDEAALRSAICEFLRKKGYRVLTAGNGAEALRTCEEHTGTIDLILTDLVMPGMDGIEVANAVVSRFPKIHVLYMSGYTSRAAELLGKGAVLLKKPFSLSDLARKLRAALEAPNQLSGV